MNSRSMPIIAMFAVLTAVGAFIRVPIPFVPFTLQAFFVILAACLLGAKKALLSQIVYVLVGLMGVPIFTMGGGPQYILQPTFGYLLGFIVAAYVCGKIVEGSTFSMKSLLVGAFSGLAVIYVFGVLYLYGINHFYLGKDFTLLAALWYGFFTCVPGDCVLMVVACMVTKKMVPILKKAGLSQV